MQGRRERERGVREATEDSLGPVPVEFGPLVAENQFFELRPVLDGNGFNADTHGEIASLLGQLMAIFEFHYDYFARNPVLSRIVLRELVFYSSGKQAEKFHEIRQRLMDAIGRLVGDAQQARQIRSREDAALIARHIFFTFSAAVRWWIATPRPDPRTGLKDLRRLIKLQIRGLQPKERI